ncbi:protein phosphatase 1 regulatory subunit 35 [Pygocentrus nattereri]|uniref:Protein phosphatase 1 regulatory subunit 35 C-terminal domain-containing protein n=1 Tax=Pygocentrus nattereri TaxID=42514 RepID=A0AAR2JV68_PYGNA|nr:protein phosphatase 1 regulatory subunit 35 [Pygocentrus nattereri]
MTMESALFGETVMQITTPPLPLSPAPLPPQCPELDLSVMFSPERPERPAASTRVLKKGRAHTRPRQVRFDVSPDSCAKPPGPHRGHLAEQHAVTTSAPQPCSSQSAAEKPQGRRGHFPSHLSAQTDGQLEEGAELNTTLALRAELQQLKEAEFDSQKAVQEKLQNSVVTQEYIRVKAAEGLNFPRSQPLYRALVSVSLSHDQIINEVLRDRPALAPPTTSYKSRPRPAEGPDLMTFYSPQQLFRETPLLPGDQIPLPRPRPEPRPAHATFHLHQRHRQWEA